jgi:hypothetical protein
LPGKRVKHTMPCNSGSRDPVLREYQVRIIHRSQGFARRKGFEESYKLVDTASEETQSTMKNVTNHILGNSRLLRLVGDTAALRRNKEVYLS